MHIRDYQSSDFPMLVSLWNESGISSPHRGDSLESIEQCNALGGKLLVMEDPLDGKIIASSWLTWDGRRIFMHHFTVLPSFQNQGYGRTLALKSLSYARQMGFPVKLEVSPKNLPAIQLYRSLGFELLGDYNVYMLNSHHDK